jgi:hypothetical protein
VIHGIGRAATASVLALALACAEEPVGPVPGTIDVVLGDAEATIGAVLFRVEGGPVDTVEAVPEAGLYLDAAPYSGTAQQVLVAGDGLSGVIARVRVPDVRVRYRVVVQQVADGQTFALLPFERIPVFLVSGVP